MTSKRNEYIKYIVFTTCHNGELRSYHFHVSPDTTINEVVQLARMDDLTNYPDNPSPFDNVSVVKGGYQVHDIVWDETVGGVIFL